MIDINGRVFCSLLVDRQSNRGRYGNFNNEDGGGSRGGYDRGQNRGGDDRYGNYNRNRGGDRDERPLPPLSASK